MKRHIGLLMILAGLVLAGIPAYRYIESAMYQRAALALLENPVIEAEQEPGSPPVTEENSPEKVESKDRLPDYLGILEIPRIKIKVVVGHGVTQRDLKRGPGFYPQSSHPEIGNVSIASHRGSHGSYFLHLDRLRKGDEIKLTLGETTYIYIVRANFATTSTDWSVIKSQEKPEITLTTCIITDLSKRLIVKGDLQEIIKNEQPDKKDSR